MTGFSKPIFLLYAKILSAEDSLRNEADRLRIISSKAEGLKPFIIARVVDRQFSNRENMLLIDGGRSRGIGTDMTVIDARGLVGRVVAVPNTMQK